MIEQVAGRQVSGNALRLFLQWCTENIKKSKNISTSSAFDSISSWKMVLTLTHYNLLLICHRWLTPIPSFITFFYCSHESYSAINCWSECIQSMYVRFYCQMYKLYTVAGIMNFLTYFLKLKRKWWANDAKTGKSD